VLCKSEVRRRLVGFAGAGDRLGQRRRISGLTEAGLDEPLDFIKDSRGFDLTGARS
jgi:hypothetical protein